MNFFKGKKSPADLVASTRRHLAVLMDENTQKDRNKSLEKLSTNTSNMKSMLYGDADHPPKADVIKKLVQEVFSSGVLLELLQAMPMLHFEAKKDVAMVCNYLLRNCKEMESLLGDKHPEVLRNLVHGYSNPDIALNCGAILREVIRHESLAKILLDPKVLESFFGYVQLETFDVASDAFETMKLLLTKHDDVVAVVLTENFDQVFEQYDQLLQSSNYVTQRQSLKLLGELLLNRKNFHVMMKYITDQRHLKTVMTLLRGRTKAIQLEAFHVFKIFVANPNKSPEVTKILVRNKNKLVDFLQKFHKTKDDASFTEERTILLNTLQKMTE